MVSLKKTRKSKKQHFHRRRKSNYRKKSTKKRTKFYDGVYTRASLIKKRKREDTFGEEEATLSIITTDEIDKLPSDDLIKFTCSKYLYFSELGKLSQVSKRLRMMLKEEIKYKVTGRNAVRYVTEKPFRIKMNNLDGKIFELEFDEDDFEGAIENDDLEHLKDIKNVIIKNCTKVTDVSALATVEKLTIENCSKLFNVDSLLLVKNLTLIELPLVTDISSLKNVETLTIEKLNSLTNQAVNTLGGEDSKVKTLTLNKLIITNVNSLRNIETLELASLENLSDVNALAPVKKLILRHMDEVRDVSSLSSVNTLIIDSCRNVENFCSLLNVKRLKLIGIKEAREGDSEIKKKNRLENVTRVLALRSEIEYLMINGEEIINL